MKRLLIALAFVMSGSFMYAQEKMPLTAAQIAERQTEKMTELLSLTEAQQEAVYAANLNASTLILQKKSNGGLSTAELIEIRNKQSAEINPLLDEGQRIKFTAMNERYATRLAERSKDQPTK